MADNYLEKQYESYQARKAAWEREKKLGKKRAHHAPSPKVAMPDVTDEGGQEQPYVNNDDNLVEND